MSVRVIRSGLLTTIQDAGRWGFQRYGVVTGGALDPLALRLANLLVGNDENAAALEMILVGPQLRFEGDSLIAITGAEMSPTIAGASLAAWRPVWVRRGSELSVRNAAAGRVAYLAVAGGCETPPVMGSRSTYLQAGIGGVEGRSLRAGDVLAMGPPSSWAGSVMHCLALEAGSRAFAATAWQAGANLARYDASPTIRVTAGSELDWLTVESQSCLFSDAFRVTSQSDRMGYRLSGPRLMFSAAREMISEAVSAGTIQVPPNGQPIVLMADRATTGGYPKAGHVAAVDLPVFAQTRPGARIRFQRISIDEAQRLYRTREAAIARLQCGIALRRG